MSYLCPPQRPNESSEDYYQRRLDFRDAKRRELIEEYYRQKESGRMSPDSDGVTFEEFGAEVRYHEREIRIEEGRPRPEDLPKRREWPRIEFPPDFEAKSLSEISGYTPERRGEERWEDFWNPEEYAAHQEEMAEAAAAAAAKGAESTRMHAGTGSPTTAPSARSGHKRKRGQDQDEHADETTLAASKKKKSRTADPTSRKMRQITRSISSRRGRSHHQHQQRKRGREDDEDVLDEELSADKTHAAKKRRTDNRAVTSGSKRRRERSEDAEEDGGRATTSKRRRTTDRDAAGPRSGRGCTTKRGAPQVASPVAAAVGESSSRLTPAAAAITAPSSMLPPTSSTRITRARRRQLAGEDANLLQLGHRGETRRQEEEVGGWEAPEATAAAAAPAAADTTLAAAAANRRRQQPASARVEAGDAANRTVSSKVSARSETRTRAPNPKPPPPMRPEHVGLGQHS